MEKDEYNLVGVIDFNKNKFANILKKINKTYESQTNFANASGVNRTYLSRYMNLNLSNPPTPKILLGIAKASKGIITYSELMQICGYYKDSNLKDLEVNMDKLKEDEMIIKISEYEEMKEQIAKLKEHQEFDTKIRNNLREENIKIEEKLVILEKENTQLKRGIINYIKVLGGKASD